MGFAVRIQPDAHLAQCPSLNGGEHQGFWLAGMTPAAGGGESTARLRGRWGGKGSQRLGQAVKHEGQGPFPQH